MTTKTLHVYRISSSAGVALGSYRASSELNAIRALNRDAGEQDLDRNDGLIIVMEQDFLADLLDASIPDEE